MSAVDIITQRSLEKGPQLVVEGITVATYAVTPTNPAFTPIGSDAALSDAATPTVAENRQAGNVDKTETTKVFEEKTVKLTCKVHTDDEDFLKWIHNEPTGASSTPDESRTLFWSYKDSDGVETFIQYLGCKPIDASMNYDKDNYLTIDANFSYKTRTTDLVGPTIGTGSFATALTTSPLTHLDAGGSPFTYNSVTTSIESFSTSVSYTMGSQDALGADTSLFKKPTQRTLSGSAVIYKLNETLQDDALLATERTAGFIIDSGVIVLAFTKFKFLPSAEELKGDSAEATKENKSWEAATLVMT